MPRIAPGTRFPEAALPDVDGHTAPLAGAWAKGPALVVLGHGDCKTTRQTLPYVDRIHRRRGASATALAVLQDDPETARGLIAELGLALPVRLEPEPYPLTEALGLTAVPTLLLVDSSGNVGQVVEAFSRAGLESLAAALGVPGPLFDPGDSSPAMRPG